MKKGPMKMGHKSPKKAKMPMTTVNGKKVPTFAVDGKGANDMKKAAAMKMKKAAMKLKKEEKSVMPMKKAAMKLKKESTMMMKKAAMKMKKVSAMKMKMKKK